MKRKRIWTIWMLVLAPATAISQLLPTRSVGLFGYHTSEPLGFNTSYSGMVDEWGNMAIPFMNLDLSSTSINERNWSPTRSVLNGQYLLTGQVEIENASARKFEETGHATDSAQFSLVGNSTSLMGARLESSGARESFNWQVSGQAGTQRLQALWDEFAPWGQPEYEVLGLYASAGVQVTKRFRISGRVAVNRSASMFNSFDFGAKQELYGSDAHRPITHLIDSVVPPPHFDFGFYDPENIPFDVVSQIEQRAALTLKAECQTARGIWTFAVRNDASRWYQRVSSNFADVTQPIGLPNASMLLSRSTFQDSGWIKWQIGFGASTRNTEIEAKSFLPTPYPTVGHSPTILDVTNQKATVGAEIFRKSKQVETTYSGRVDFTTLYGIRPSGSIHLSYHPNNSLQGQISLGHDWREPSPFEHQWKSFLNADGLNSQSSSGQIAFLHPQFQFEHATYAQIQFLCNFGRDDRTQVEITAPFAMIHQQWNVDMKGDTPGLDFDFGPSAMPGFRGILLSYEPCKLSGINTSATHTFTNGSFIRGGYQRSTTLQQKGGQWKREYLMPANRLHLSATKNWQGTKPKFRFTTGISLERIGPALYSIDLMGDYTSFDFELPIKDRQSEPITAIACDATIALNPSISFDLSIHHVLLKREVNPVFWNVEDPDGNDLRNAYFGIAFYEANFSPATAPIVPTQARIQINLQF